MKKSIKKNKKTYEIDIDIDLNNLNELSVLEIKKMRLNELSKDFIQDYIGLDVGDLEAKKKEFVKLLNEVRKIEGKSEKLYQNKRS